jgi:hypothetical protein
MQADDRRSLDRTSGAPASGGRRRRGALRAARWAAALALAATVTLACGGGGGGERLDTTPPSAPVGLAASEVTSSSLRLCWSPSTDDTAVTGYTVVRQGSAATAPTTEPCATFDGLSGSLSYTFTVTAQDAAGNSSPASAPYSVTTAADAGGCVVPDMPAFAALTAIATLPDPFRRMDGGRITRTDQWHGCRRSEIAALAQQFELGQKPPDPSPSAVAASLAGDVLTVTVTEGGSSITFDATITYPETGTAPYPLVIGIGTGFGRSGLAHSLTPLGVAVVDLPNDEIAEQIDGSSRGKGDFYTLYGSTHSAGALMAWSWGVSRLIDALEQTPAAQIDTERIGVTGCSRNGKGALIAGAFDERVALTIPQESGAGGAASWRVSEVQEAAAPGQVQTLRQIVTENVWFTPTFTRFRTAVTRLPFDHHEVAGLVAPRALLVIENTSMAWLGNVSTFTSASAAHRIWEALGAPDRMGYSQVAHGDHCVLPAAQQPEVEAYVSRFLLGGADDTAIFRTDGGFTLDQARWLDWTVPTLE